MAASSKSRSNNAPVLPLTFSFPHSISSTGRYSGGSSSPSDPFSSSSLPSTTFASSSSSSMASSIFHRPSSPTRVNLSPPPPSFRISLNNRSLSPNSRAVSIRDHHVVSKPATKRTCMCSPTSHPGSFRCSLHRNGGKNVSHQTASYSPIRLNLRRSAMTNSLVRIGTVEGDWVRRALTALIRPSSHHQRRRGDFQPRLSRLSIMSKAGDNDVV